MRIAMWSGPRNLSTAMMYAFAARGDFAVWDEPFYAPYLRATGIDHPMRDEILGSHECDPAAVAARCAGPIPGKKPNFYMKHMAFHMLEGFPMGWAEGATHVHLIRHPARVVASYAAKRERPTLADIGFEAQAEIFARCPGPVIDSADIRQDPEVALAALCAEIGLPFDRAMLSWPPGGHPEDGIWAAHWYGAVHRSTGFAGAEGPLPELDGAYADLARAAMPFYEAMSARALTFMWP
ncbi:sulfotransferase-like domain-containing protein [Ovoidimarina sediminis]|uniref:sulfotransferase-like domain-containing protein n=1 Tax=Ovoidimarina sediminis TaxID=3079856 RepID=UPI00290B5BFA|nr:HAD family hydrolase [Rhodophyticola sp. MJ-SS7]MDU8942639.1 HAD family hydrolase [Rhodophyticola sp. MJ-SS7]